MAMSLEQAIQSLQGMFADIPADTLAMVRAPPQLPTPIAPSSSLSRPPATRITPCALRAEVEGEQWPHRPQVLEAHSGHMERTIEYLLESQLGAESPPPPDQVGAPAGSVQTEADFAAALTVTLNTPSSLH